MANKEETDRVLKEYLSSLDACDEATKKLHVMSAKVKTVSDHKFKAVKPEQLLKIETLMDEVLYNGITVREFIKEHKYCPFCHSSSDHKRSCFLVQ